jgi:4-amino-4-deoxy-L-arabinose transferase-like glycosyltransferase
MKKAWNFIVTMWRPALFFIALLCLLGVMFGFRLGGLVGHASVAEVQTFQASDSLNDIWNNPVNAPYKLIVYILHLVSVRISFLRLASVGVGVLTILFFYLIARRLYEPLTAVGVTVMLATATIFLQTTRTLEASCMLLGLVFLLWVAFIFRYYRATQLAWILGSLLVGLTLYTPGIFIFVLAGLIWQQKRIRESFEQLKPATIAVATTLLFAALVPIVVNLFVEPSSWHDFLGLPAHFDTLLNMLKATLYVPLSVVGMSPADPSHWLGHQPILDVVGAIFFVYGLISVIQRPKLDRLWALLGIFTLGCLWVGITGVHSNIIVLVPFIYLTMGFGIQGLLDLWFSVFPNNPLARTMGSIMLTIAILFSINFQVLRYYIAWAHAPETRATHSQQIPAPAPAVRTLEIPK